MKKTLLAAATLSTLMASGMANAAFTDADGSGGWTGNLEFNGAITNTNPIWQYQIPEATIAGAKNWNVERESGTVDGSNTNFSFSKDFTVLEGVMKAPAPNGGPGMKPVVTFGETDNAVVWDTTNTSLSKPTAITLSAKNGSNNVGSLTFNLIGQAVAKGIDNNGQTGPESANVNVPKALALLKAKAYYAPTYASLPTWSGGSHDAGKDWNSTGVLSETHLTELSAALVASADNFKLSFPTASIPNEWTATLPISITVK